MKKLSIKTALVSFIGIRVTMYGCVAHDLKRKGACVHVMIWTTYRFGCGGNLITEDQWRRYEGVRLPYEPAYKNPMRVYMRVGGDYGYCGGVQVAEQVKQVFPSPISIRTIIGHGVDSLVFSIGHGVD
jgi:hypothetical protein